MDGKQQVRSAALRRMLDGEISLNEYEATLPDLNGLAAKRLRLGRSRKLWKCMGEEFTGTYADYLAGVPEIPESLRKYDEDFPHLALLDSTIGLSQLCRVLNVLNDTAVKDSDFLTLPGYTQPLSSVWVRVDAGRIWASRGVREFEFFRDFTHFGLTLQQTLCLMAQLPEVYGLSTCRHRDIVVPGTKYRDYDIYTHRPQIRYDGDFPDIQLCHIGKKTLPYVLPVCKVG